MARPASTRMNRLWPGLALLVLLAGCSSPAAPDATEGADPRPGQVTSPDGAVLVPLRFASGDFEGILTFEATFSSLDTCFGQCTATAVQTFDLTDIVPAAAPVELAITITGTDGGMAAYLEFADASPVRENTDYQSAQIQVAATVVRDEGGQVSLRVVHAIPTSPSAEPVDLRIEARSVSRAGQLLPGIPARLAMSGGDALAVAGADVARAILFAPDGSAQRSVAGDLNLSLPSDSPPGEYTLVVEGGTATVAGPNTTLAARRLATRSGDWQPLPMGIDVKWAMTADAVPLQAGLMLRSQPTSTRPSSFVGPYGMTLAAPDGTVVTEGRNPDCDVPICQIGYFVYSYSTPFMDPRLQAGPYSAVARVETGDGIEATAFYVTFL